MLKNLTLQKIKKYESFKINYCDQTDKDKIYLLNRGAKPIWTYSLSKNKVLKKINFTKNGISLRNPTSISMFEKNLFICDKENDRIIKVKQ